jgi:hypothetical protein
MTTDPHVSRAPLAAAFPRPLGDRFELVGELDYGRLGTVYEAIDRTRPVSAEDRTVALLRIPLLTGRSSERIERDFARLLSLRHPNIVRVFELIRGEDAYLVTMELVDGEPLCSVLDSLLPELPSRDEAFAVIRAVGAALVHAHARGAVHGDVDVANVLIGAPHEVKVPFAAAWLLRREAFAARARDDTRGLARIANQLLTGADPPGGFGRPAQGERKPRAIHGLGRAKRRALRAALYGRDDRAPDVGELVAAFAPPAEVRASRAENQRGAPRFAWGAVLIAAILVVSYALYRDDLSPAEPIVDAEVAPLDAGDEIDQSIEDEPAIDYDDPEGKPASG